ncbi:MAG: hypothetical protein GW859_00810 [Sphingomonadales bacterium]|nr:hypothetical protein [Sphingomonadales bacterium]
MTDDSPRPFASDAAIRDLGEGLLACALPRSAWTHEAHLAATLYLALERPEIDLERDLPGIIRAFNESVGGVNDDTQGYHETITQVFLRGVRLHIAATGTTIGLADCVNALLVDEKGRRDWPLRFYTKERLFSSAARREFVAPDRAPLPKVD